eukprot:Pgem_evm1s2982
MVVFVCKVGYLVYGAPGGKILRVIRITCDDNFLNEYVNILQSEIDAVMGWCLEEEFLPQHVTDLMKKLSNANHRRSRHFRDIDSMNLCYTLAKECSGSRFH